MFNIIKTKNLSKKVRLQCIKMVYYAKASHIGSALSIVDLLSVLYKNIMKTYPKDHNNQKRDRFILSKGHATVALYSILAEMGYFPRELLKSYGQNSSIMMNHVSHKVPGVEYSTGSLGHGLSFGIGKAYSAKLKGLNYNVYVLLSDGEMQEGSNWEALMFASHHNLNNLIAIIDYNNLQSLRTVEDTLQIEPLKFKLESFGWNVYEIDGHSYEEIYLSFLKAKKSAKKPSIIIAKTIKGKGLSFMQNKVEWHYKSPNEKEYLLAKDELENA